MADKVENEAELRAVRDRLLADLAELDRLGEGTAAIELNSAIEILNKRLGEPTDDNEVIALWSKRFMN